jgi:cbb3-type cytochrome oxidase maturation protein
MTITILLFAGAVCMGVAGALVWAWAVRSGQLRDLEKTKEQLFWPDLAAGNGDRKPVTPAAAGSPRRNG